MADKRDRARRPTRVRISVPGSDVMLHVDDPTQTPALYRIHDTVRAVIEEDREPVIVALARDVYEKAAAEALVIYDAQGRTPVENLIGYPIAVLPLTNGDIYVCTSELAEYMHLAGQVK